MYMDNYDIEVDLYVYIYIYLEMKEKLLFFDEAVSYIYVYT